MGIYDSIVSRASDTVETIKSTVTDGGVSEQLSASQQFQRFRSGSFGLNVGEMITDIFGEERMTPHEEMREVHRMLQNNIQVAQTVSKKNLMLWGREISVDTDDDETKEYFENEVIPKFREAAMTAGRNAVAAGNGHIEIVRGENTGFPIDFKPMLRPHKVYNIYEEGEFGEIKGYIQESFRDPSTVEGATARKVLVGDRRTKRVRGTVFDEDDVIHLRVGSSVMPGYGRSDFMSGRDAYKIQRELIRAQAIMARTKSIPRKAFVFNENDQGSGISEPGQTANTQSRRDREEELNNLGPTENPVFHDTQLEVKDYSYNPDVGGFQDTIEKLDRDLTSPLPEFMSHSNNGTQTPSKFPFSGMVLELQAIRERWRSAIDPVFREIAEKRGLDENVSIQFGDFTLQTREEKTSETMQLFERNILTLGQAVSRLPVDVDVRDEFVDKYRFELEPQQDPFQELKDRIDEVQSVDKSEVEDVLKDSDGGGE